MDLWHEDGLGQQRDDGGKVYRLRKGRYMLNEKKTKAHDDTT